MKKISYIILPLTFVVILAIGFIFFPQTTEASCGVDITCHFKENIIPGIVGVVLKLLSLLTGLSGILLNGVIYHTIVNMADNYSNLPAISDAWGTIRDLANMSFIFILLYAAIQLILGIGQNTQKLIVNIVVVAILINFSMFFTKLVIDASNVIAVTFYGAMAPGALESDKLLETGLSNAFMEYLNLSSLYKVAAGNTLTSGSLITVGIMGSLLLLIASFVFLSIAIMLVIRYVVLIFVIILSPIAFISMVLPQMGKYKDQWWDALSGQAFFAPIYFMLTWIALKVMDGIFTANTFGTSGGEAAAGLAGIALGENGVSGAQGFFATFIGFAVVIAFILISLIVAKEWSGKAGAGVKGLTKWATGAAGGATLGLAGRAGRETFGALGSSIGDSERLKKAMERGQEDGAGAKARMAGAASRMALIAGRKTAGANFDLRGTALGKNLDAGKAQKGGYSEDLKKSAEAKRKFGESLGPTDIVKDEAKMELQRIKDLDINSEGFENERKESRRKQAGVIVQRREALMNAQDELANYTRFVREGRIKGDAETRDRLLADIDAKNTDLETSQADARMITSKDKGEYKKLRVREAQNEHDKLIGVDDDRAKQMIKERYESEGKAGDYATYIKSDAGKVEIARLKKNNPSAENRRKESEAKRLRTPRTLNNPRLIIGKSSKQAVADLKKGKKPVKDQLEAILKEAGDIKEDIEEAKEEGDGKTKVT